MNLTEQIGNLHALKEAAMIDEKAGKTPKLSSKAIGIVKHYYMERNRINRKALTFTTIFLCGTVFLIKNHSLLGNPHSHQL